VSFRSWIIRRKEQPDIGWFKQSLHFFAKYYLPAFFLLWGAVWVVQWVGRTHVEHRLCDVAQEELRGVEALWDHELAEVNDDLHVMVEHDMLLRWVDQEDKSARHDLEQAWYYFVSLQPEVTRIRFIDIHGQELMAVTDSNGKYETVSEEKRHDVSSQGDLARGMRLESGEIDSVLYRESKQSRDGTPITTPVLRVVEPVYLNGVKRGVVAVDILLDELTSLLRDPGVSAWQDHLIVNQAGVYLRSVGNGKSWGFIPAEVKDRVSFSSENPVAWERMQNRSSDVFFLDGVGYVYRKVGFPWHSKGLAGADGDQHWYFINLVTPDSVDQVLQGMVRNSYVIVTLASVLLLLFLILYVRLSRSEEGYLHSATVLGEKLQAVMDTAPDAIFTFNENGGVESFNEATLKMFACGEEDFARASLSEVIPENYTELVELIRKSKDQRNNFHLTVRREFNARRFDGSWFPMELSLRETNTDEMHNYIVIARDITDRKAAEEQIQRRALYDDLTNLPNRNLLRGRLESLLALSQRRRVYGALLFMDLDNFKNINDSMGHYAGDMLLCRVAERLTRTLRGEDMVSRLGGDEFVAVLPMLSDDQSAASVKAREVAEKIRLALNQPLMLEGHEYVTTPSIGIVLFPTDGVTADDVLRQADTAMYRAKAAGRNTIRFFHPSMQTEVNDRLRIGKELRIALDQEQLELYLQPQVDTEFDCIVGAEALIRWNHPVRGLLGPDSFIPHAEELGMIGLVGEWVLQKGFVILHRLLTDLPCHGLETLAINVSPRHFRNSSFIPRLRALMKECQVPPHRIELEITENLLMEDLDAAVVKMNAIKEMGFGFAIDDFGTGFSSLSYLRKLPVGRLKIDRSFITQVDTDKQNAAIVKSILAMAKIQGLAVTAEGVEREEEKLWLMEEGCSHVQGFYYSRPLSLDSFMNYCREYELRKSPHAESER
jgi:diguanylate cyclase (GGDEF)-like protein/PAS domain S-box-containing protein